MYPIQRSLLLIAGLVLAFSAASAADPKPPKADIPPPPDINDPGVSAPAAARTAEQPQAAPVAEQDPLAPLPKPDSRLVRDKGSREGATNAQRIAASQVTRRHQGTDTVEEYRQHGHVWMIRIVPQTGPTRTFLDPDGHGLQRDAEKGPISPVYYTLYEWQ